MKKLPEGIKIHSACIQFIQDEDCCGRNGEDGQDGQELFVHFEDGGGGFYFVLNTERWAVDADDGFFKWINEFCENLNDNSFWGKDQKEKPNG